jgi:chaperonin GroES
VFDTAAKAHFGGALYEGQLTSTFFLLYIVIIIKSLYKKEGFMTIKPLSDRVLVKVEEAETKSAGGIIIPDTAQEKTQAGKVIAVGPGTEKDKITVSVGQKVMYDKYAGSAMKIDGADCLIVKMQDIIAVIE